MVSVLRPGVVGKIIPMREIPFKIDAVSDELAGRCLAGALSAASRNVCEVVCPRADLCGRQPGDTLVTKAISIHAGVLRGVKKHHEKTKGGSPKESALDAESFGGNASRRPSPIAATGSRRSSGCSGRRPAPCR